MSPIKDLWEDQVSARRQQFNDNVFLRTTWLFNGACTITRSCYFFINTLQISSGTQQSTRSRRKEDARTGLCFNGRSGKRKHPYRHPTNYSYFASLWFIHSKWAQSALRLAPLHWFIDWLNTRNTISLAKCASIAGSNNGAQSFPVVTHLSRTTD